eukprot:GHUV01047076.1.p1 GENE.GHUV01047076.1~~GHUV01047076.1.p1  ORF type:complete len:276 (+),score=22.19 GHUV01047076.1:327-1154(+)
MVAVTSTLHCVSGSTWLLSCVAGEPVRAIDVARTTYPKFKIIPSSTSTSGRQYFGLERIPWELNAARKQQIRGFVEERVGPLLLSRDPRPSGSYVERVLEGEYSCNAMFDGVYGVPAAAILSRYYGRSIQFQLECPYKQHEGNPDFIFKMLPELTHKPYQYKQVIVAEAKTPSVLKDFGRAVLQPGLCPDVDASCGQVCDYVKLRKHAYTWLTSLNETVFIERRGYDTYAFSPVFAPDDEDLTVMEMLLCVCMRVHATASLLRSLSSAHDGHDRW